MMIARFKAAVLLALVSALLSPAAARPLADVVASKVLRVVVYDDNKPFSWTEGDVATGIDVEIARKLAEQLGVAVQIIVRPAGENVDDDLRVNVWRGPLTGGAVGDVMLHVPVDRELAARNDRAVISNPYYEHRIALATNTGKTGSNPAFEVFKSEKIAVQRTTASDYFLMTAYGGQLRQNVVHFVGFGDAADAFVKGEVAALMGTRAQIEGHLKDSIEPSGISEPATPGIVRSSWVIGTAVKSDNRDLDNAIGKALSELRLSGALPEIFGRFGVTYRPSLAP